MKRQYKLEFKVYAVQLSYEMNSVLSAAWELSVSPSTIYRWRKKISSMEKNRDMDKNMAVREEIATRFDNSLVAGSEQFFFLWWFIIAVTEE